MTSTPRDSGPETLCERFATLVAHGDLDGITGLYAVDAVVTLPRGREAAGTTAIRAAFAAALAAGADLCGGGVASSRAVVMGDVAMTSTTGLDGQVRTQVARREPCGRWVWFRDSRHLCDVDAALPGSGDGECGTAPAA